MNPYAPCRPFRIDITDAQEQGTNMNTSEMIDKLLSDQFHFLDTETVRRKARFDANGRNTLQIRPAKHLGFNETAIVFFTIVTHDSCKSVSWKFMSDEYLSNENYRKHVNFYVQLENLRVQIEALINS